MKNRVGETYLTNEGYKITIIEYLRTNNCTIQFENGAILKEKHYSNIKKGKIKNIYHKSVFNIGFLGEGAYKTCIDSKDTKEYTTWKEMLRRCYDNAFLDRHPTYLKCSVDPSWHNFQNFAKWFQQNYIENFDLDKDILTKGNKIYGPDTCCFVPQQINNLFVKSNENRGKYPIGVRKRGKKFNARIKLGNEEKTLGVFLTAETAFKAYKKAKEKQIKEIAALCRSIISNKVYMALINYQVEITD